MKPPWMDYSGDDAELEALQTDVMRFIAILGLCLAAIFSLVQTAAVEQAGAPAAVNLPLQQVRGPAKAETAAGRETRTSQIPVPNAATRPDPPASTAEPRRESLQSARIPAPVPPPETPAPAPGFTLEFASAAALETLLRDGQVTLYARHEDQFWSVDAHGNALRVEAPSSYYQMLTDTVPPRLRRSPLAPAKVSQLTWGVTLPPGATSRIQQLTSAHQAGNLLIGPAGGVTLGTVGKQRSSEALHAQ